MKYCNQCGRLISRVHNKCIYCGATSLLEIPPLFQVKQAFLPLDELVLNNKLYNISGLISKGGFGYILLIEDAQTGELFALKLPLTAFHLLGTAFLMSEDEDKIKKSEEMLRKEIKLLSSLNHPGIISIISSGEIPFPVKGRTVSIPYYIMELAYGDVEALMSNYPKISLNERIKIIKELATALAYLHALHIVYRDLSLKNILIMDRGNFGIRYVLSDFGAGKEMESHTRGFSSVIGTERYLDPAYLLDSRKYRRDPRIDVYSLGVVATELMLGTSNWVEFSGIGSGVIVTSINFAEEIIRPYVQNGVIPQPIGEVLYRATLREPENRFVNAEEFLVAFKEATRVLRGGVTTTPSLTPTPAFTPQPSSRPSPLTIPVRFRLNLPFRYSESTYQPEKIQYKQGTTIELSNPLGAEIVLPSEYFRPKVIWIKGPRFMDLIPTMGNSFYIRLNRGKIQKLLEPLLSIDPNAEGEMEFEGKIKVEV